MAMTDKRLTWGLPPIWDNIPPELKKQTRWVNWREKVKKHGKRAKVPVKMNGAMASTRRPRDWTTFDKAKQHYEDDPSLSGVGFVLTGAKAAISIIDLDDCYNPIDGPDDWAMEIIKRADSYTEISPSERGLRIILFNDLGAFINNEQGLEVYTQDSTRYLTITGHTLDNHREIKRHGHDKFARYLDRYRPPPRETRDAVGNPVRDTPESIERILEELVERDSELEHYEPWLHLGMALHHQFDGAWEGMEMWDRVSQPLGGYDAAEFEPKWDSFSMRGSGALTLRTIFDRAKDHGINIRGTMAAASADDFPDLDDDGNEVAADHEQVMAEVVADHEEVMDEPQAKPWRTLHQLAATKPPKQLVEDLIARRQISQVSGPPGAGKTFVVMELCRAICTGSEIFGMRTVPGPVLYLAYEGVSAMESRVRAWEARGETLPSNLYVIDDAPALSEPKSWMQWLQPIFKELKPVMVVIDTLAQALPGMSTNDEEKVGAVQRSLRNLVKQTSCHVLTVHHPPKGGAATGQKSRGSGIIEGDLDTQIWVTSGEGKAHTWEVSKQRGLGSLGKEAQFVIRTIQTGMETDFGPERAAYLSVEVQDEDRYSPELMELQRMVQDAIQVHGGGTIDKKSYNTVIAKWLANEYPGISKDMASQRRAQAKAHLMHSFEVDVNGSNQVQSVSLR